MVGLPDLVHKTSPVGVNGVLSEGVDGISGSRDSLSNPLKEYAGARSRSVSADDSTHDEDRATLEVVFNYPVETYKHTSCLIEADETSLAIDVVEQAVCLTGRQEGPFFLTVDPTHGFAERVTLYSRVLPRLPESKRVFLNKCDQFDQGQTEIANAELQAALGCQQSLQRDAWEEVWDDAVDAEGNWETLLGYFDEMGSTQISAGAPRDVCPTVSPLTAVKQSWKSVVQEQHMVRPSMSAIDGFPVDRDLDIPLGERGYACPSASRSSHETPPRSPRGHPRGRYSTSQSPRSRVACSVSPGPTRRHAPGVGIKQLRYVSSNKSLKAAICTHEDGEQVPMYIQEDALRAVKLHEMTREVMDMSDPLTRLSAQNSRAPMAALGQPKPRQSSSVVVD